MNTFVAAILAILTAILSPILPKAEENSTPDRLSAHESIVVASYNTAAPWGNILQGTGSIKRSGQFADELLALAPDSMGVQEMNSIWVGRLSVLADEYAYYGEPRDDISSVKETEMSGIFYLKDKYDLLESDTFWISETPEVMSIYPGAGCYRTCSYVVLRNRETGFTYAHLNTHLDNVSAAAQNLGGELIAQKAQALSEKYGGNLTMVVTGDFNQYVTGEACTTLLGAGFQNASDVAPGAENQVTYHGWGEITSGQPIDFIFYSGELQAQNYTVYTEKTGRAYTSDHYCISAEFDIQ